MASTSSPQLEEFDTDAEVLCSILSYLPLREAVRTSVLSSRWRYIWTLLTKFNFDAINVLGVHRSPNKEGTNRYIQSVNLILQQLRGAKIHDFSIQYFLGGDHSIHINAWIRFAMASKTRSLSLHISDMMGIYNFPFYLLGPSLERLSLSGCYLALPHKYDDFGNYIELNLFDGFRHLIELNLCNVYGSDDDFNQLLSDCSSTLTKLSLANIQFWKYLRWPPETREPMKMPKPLSQLQTLLLSDADMLIQIEIIAVNLLKLECLRVRVDEEEFNRFLSNCSSMLRELVLLEFDLVHSWMDPWRAPQLKGLISIPFPLSELRSLLVHDCSRFTKIEINAVNLMKLDYKGLPVDFVFTQSLNLYDAHICFTQGTAHNLEVCVTKLSSSLPHLQSLTLRICGVCKVDNLPKGSRSFVHLRRLSWEWDDSFKMSLLHLAIILDATPFLEELKLWFLIRVIEQPPQVPNKFREMIPKHLHPRLKTIQVSDFYFDTWQIEIAAYLLNIATVLESLMVKKGNKASWFSSKEIHERGTKILSQEVPRNVKLVIL